MSSNLAVCIFIALLQSYVFFRHVRGFPETDFVSKDCATDDHKEDQESLENLGINELGKWEVVCENENLSLKCDAGEVINIIDAEYGRNDRTTCASYPNFNNSQCLSHWGAVYLVKQRCHNKRRCSMKFSNQEFGKDPCPGFIKYLKIKYACKQERSAIRESVTLCESRSQQITCKNGTSIMVTDAIYGRNDRVTCCCSLMKDTDCSAKNALEIVSARCDYKKSCILEASNKVFGDPCSGTIKYLKVDYLCLPDKVHHVRNCERTEVKLECEKNSYIDVIDAHYGRAHPFICHNGLQPYLKEGCTTNVVTSSVKESCNNKNWCVLPASNEIFGDPCIGYTKYLDVEYSCNEIEG